MKVKCDNCWKREDATHNTMKIVGKPKRYMTNEELKSNRTVLGDNRTFEKRYCRDCLKTKKDSV